MRRASRRSRKGIAMAMAIVLALIVSAVAAAVLGFTFRRFELSAFRTDHAVAEAADEAGLQYAFARLDKDTTSTNPAFPGVVGFKNLVIAKRHAAGNGPKPDDTPAAEYVVTANDDLTADEPQVQALIMGGKVDTAAGSPTFGQYIGVKNVTVRVRFFDSAPPYNDTVPVAGQPYKVRSSSTFGTGGP